MSTTTPGKAAILVCAALASSALAQTVTVQAGPGAALSPQREAEAAAQFGLARAEFFSLHVPPGASREISVALPVDGRWVEFDLWPHSVRAPGYRLLVDDGRGLLEVELPAERTVRGVVRGDPGSIVAGSILDDGLSAVVLTGAGKMFTIEPVAGRVAGVPADVHVVYRPDQLLDSGLCGAAQPAPPEALHRVGGEAAESLDAADVENQWDGQSNTAAAAGGACVTEVAVDCDYEYYQARGSSVAATELRVLEVINAVNVMGANNYLDGHGIEHQVSATIVRTTAIDPYSANEASSLLNELVSEWNDYQTAVRRDVVHLFTGRNMDGSTIGIAYLGQICRSMGYGLSQVDWGGATVTSAALVVAHELGHNWSATHCDCVGYIMNPSVGGSSNGLQGFHPSLSTPQIKAHKDSRTCLTCGLAAPLNDACSSAISVASGTYAGATVGASQDGAASCGNYDDVWYKYANATRCRRDVTVTTCNASLTFDTVLSAHDGCGSSVETEVACNDDVACAYGSHASRLKWTVPPGATHYIRVSGYDNGGVGPPAFGSFQLGVSSVWTDPTDSDADGFPDECDLCPGLIGDGGADSDGDGVGNLCDVCPGGNDNVDTDADGVPDACDPCRFDNPDDTDGDGACDTADGCPDDPNRTAPGPCGCGEADDDADADDVCNALDVCPNTVPGADADAQGCPPFVPGDSDRDGDVDSGDFHAFQICWLGPWTPPSLRCRVNDLDRDGDVDHVDFGLFQVCLSGENVPADPSCGG